MALKAPYVQGGGLVEEVRNMLAIIAAVLLVAWLLGLIAFHITTGALHIILAIAVILFILHFVRGRAAA